MTQDLQNDWHRYPFGSTWGDVILASPTLAFLLALLIFADLNGFVQLALIGFAGIAFWFACQAGLKSWHRVGWNSQEFKFCSLNSRARFEWHQIKSLRIRSFGPFWEKGTGRGRFELTIKTQTSSVTLESSLQGSGALAELLLENLGHHNQTDTLDQANEKGLNPGGGNLDEALTEKLTLWASRDI